MKWASDYDRGDGLTIQKLADEHWIILPGIAPAVDHCPCCDKPFESRRLARRVADWLYVPEPEPPAAA